MIKTFKEVNDRLREEKKMANELIKILNALKTESTNNGGKNLESIITNLFELHWWVEQLEITIATNKKLGKRTSDIPITPVTEIANFEYMPKS